MSSGLAVQLHDFLPYNIEIKRHGQLKTSLAEYRALLEVAHRAFACLQDCLLEECDSLVGDNACQIRAIWILVIHGKLSSEVKSLIGRIVEIKKDVDPLLTDPKMTSLVRGGQSLLDVFRVKKLGLSLSVDEQMVVASYCLARTKRVSPNQCSLSLTEFSNPKSLQDFGVISSQFALELVKKMKRTLSDASVRFVQETAATLPDHPRLAEMVGPQFVIPHPQLPFVRCLPMFWTYQTLLLGAQNQGIPLVLKVKFLEGKEGAYSVIRESSVVFKPVNGVYEESGEIDPEAPACIIQGVATQDHTGHLLTETQWKAHIRERSVIDVVLAGAADHRQFPDPALDQQFEGAEDYRRYKQMAERGFSENDPSIFFIQHVYASKVGRI